MYAYLTVSTRGCDLVHFPDGTVTVAEAGGGAAIAASWRSPSAPEGPGQKEDSVARQAQTEEALDQWRAELNRRLDGILSVGQGREIREDYEREHPRPGSPLAADADSASGTPGARVEPSEWWFAVCPEANLMTPLAESTESMPRAALAAVLTTLERDGWSVVHLSEERVVQHEDDLSRAILVEASILLHS